MPKTRSSSKNSTSTKDDKNQEEQPLKRPANARSIFTTEKKNELKEKHKDKKAKEINEMVSKEWEALSEDGKKVYQDKAAALKKAYDEEKKKRAASAKSADEDDEGAEEGDEDAGKKRKRGKKTKDPNALKKPLSAYMIWLQENREAIKKENPDIKPTDVARIGGAKWKELTADGKKPFEEKAKVLKAEYTKKKEEAGEGAKETPKKRQKTNKKKKDEEEDEEEEDDDE